MTPNQAQNTRTTRADLIASVLLVLVIVALPIAGEIAVIVVERYALGVGGLR